MINNCGIVRKAADAHGIFQIPRIDIDFWKKFKISSPT